MRLALGTTPVGTSSPLRAPNTQHGFKSVNLTTTPNLATPSPATLTNPAIPTNLATPLPTCTQTSTLLQLEEGQPIQPMYEVHMLTLSSS